MVVVTYAREWPVGVQTSTSYVLRPVERRDALDVCQDAAGPPPGPAHVALDLTVEAVSSVGWLVRALRALGTPDGVGDCRSRVREVLTWAGACAAADVHVPRVGGVLSGLRDVMQAADRLWPTLTPGRRRRAVAEEVYARTRAVLVDLASVVAVQRAQVDDVRVARNWTKRKARDWGTEGGADALLNRQTIELALGGELEDVRPEDDRDGET